MKNGMLLAQNSLFNLNSITEKSIIPFAANYFFFEAVTNKGVFT